MLQVNFIMLCILVKILVFKITKILKRFLRSIIHFYFLKNFFFLFQDPIMESSSFEKQNLMKYVKNHFRLEKF